MTKFVTYNGQTESYYGCSDPSLLTVGKVYEVTSVTGKGWQTDITLKGVSGKFNSCWFESVEEENPVRVFVGISRNIPCIGERYTCSIIYAVDGGRPFYKKTFTSPVKEINNMGANVYCIRTYNSLYIITVG